MVKWTHISQCQPEPGTPIIIAELIKKDAFYEGAPTNFFLLIMSVGGTKSYEETFLCCEKFKRPIPDYHWTPVAGFPLPDLSKSE